MTVMMSGLSLLYLKLDRQASLVLQALVLILHLCLGMRCQQCGVSCRNYSISKSIYLT